MTTSNNQKVTSGFTLIELLVVMAIMMVIAVVLIVALDPINQVAKTRDAGRISAVIQLGHAVQTYYLANDETFPSVADWDTDLESTGQPVSFPDGIEYITSGISACTTNVKPSAGSGYCYDYDDLTDNALVFGVLESESQRNKCFFIGSTYYVYSTADGRGGIVCGADDPTPWEKGTQPYLN